MNKRQGISLIVLVITILVMIILAGVVVVSLQKNNPIEKAKKAKLMTNVQSFMEEFNMITLNELKNNSEFDKKTLNANTYEEMKKYIPSFKKEYEDLLKIKEGNVYFNSLIGNKEKFSHTLFELGLKPLLYNQNEEFKFKTIKDGVMGLEYRGGNSIIQGCKFYNVIFVPAENLNEASLSIDQPDAEEKNELLFENCRFIGKFTLDNHNRFYRAKFINCEFDDVQIKPLVNEVLSNKKIEFINCKIRTKDRPTIKFASEAYDRGNINLIFNNCEIINTGNIKDIGDGYGTSQAFINIFAVPTSGKIDFINSTISMECPLIHGYNRSNSDINFNINLTNSNTLPELPDYVGGNVNIIKK